MEKINYEEFINRFFDEELSEGEEKLLFSTLSTDSEARELFKQTGFMKTLVEFSQEDVPQRVDEKIYTAVRRDEKTALPARLKPYLAYATTLLFLALSIFLFLLARNYKEDLNRMKRVVRYQNTALELVVNSLPTVNVNESLPNEIVINKNL